ncbi:alpha/beta fold hydrolase [Microbacterium sp. SS28]|uniref:alpha/beta fold hydrolase n=1 Tax=Microbacterium sp. SS28 TaxID=2919948 RepID=UPI001FA96213|nr:alpha/beta hydrolase [Microbacterium sp. SS28]
MVKVMTLTDGRELTYDECGDPDGVPVIFNHGVGSSRLHRNADDGLIAALGVRMLCVDQPGSGGSTPQPGRRLVTWGADVEELADALGLDRFTVSGHSGGGAHALAIAARLPDRVIRGVLASPIGPLSEPRFAKTIQQEDLLTLMALSQSPDELRPLFDTDADDALADPAAYVRAKAEHDPFDADTFLADPAQRAMFERAFAEGASQGGEGRYEAWMAAAMWDWGFSLNDIRQRFDVFCGDYDTATPVAMSALLTDSLPYATLHVWVGAGHNGFVDRVRWTEFIAAVKTQ